MDLSHRNAKAHSAVTPERRTVFLEALAQTGVYSWASKQASPYAKHSASKSFKSLECRDPEFRSQVVQARETARERILLAMRERGVDGFTELVVQKGAVVYHEGKPLVKRVYSDRLLEIMARSAFPEKFTPRHQVEHSGAVGSAGATLTWEDISALSQTDRDELMRILRVVQTARREPIEGEVFKHDEDGAYLLDHEQL